MNSFFKSLIILICFLSILWPLGTSAQDPYNSKGWQGIIIQEILPNPVDKDRDKEWIKLYNSSNQEINLKNWVLVDRFGQNHFFVFQKDTWLEDDDYIIMSRSETQITLNNFEEELSLFDPAGELIDQISYINAPAGETLLYSDNSWRWGTKEKTTLQPETPNIVEGIVITLPGDISLQYFFIARDAQQSETIQIYNYKKEFPKLKLGDYIKISGEFSDINNYLRFKISKPEDIEILNHQPPISPLNSSDLNNSLGKLVSISGTIIDKDGKYLILDNEIKLDPSLLTVKPATNDRVKASGIVLTSSKYKYVKILPDYGIKKINKETSNKIIVLSVLSALSLAGLATLKNHFD